MAYWATQMQSQLEAWLNIADRYLAWIEILGEKTAEEIAGLDPDALPAFREALHHAPSLQDLARRESRLDHVPPGNPGASGLRTTRALLLDRSRF